LIAAIVPAAGESRRMGRPKLLLPVGGQPVLRRVVTALQEGGAELVVVVAPPIGWKDFAFEFFLEDVFIHIAETQPADMRASFELGLSYLELNGVQPTTILLTPADCPGLTADLVAAVIRRSSTDPMSVIIPTFHDRRGHPIALPWELATAVRDLPAGVGVNALVAASSDRVVELPVSERGAVEDMDTLEDYQRWLESEGANPV
jgi:molybdenum cofactor cytidylyltransferase